jgi:hypothetical protein
MRRWERALGYYRLHTLDAVGVPCEVSSSTYAMDASQLVHLKTSPRGLADERSTGSLPGDARSLVRALATLIDDGGAAQDQYERGKPSVC